MKYFIFFLLIVLTSCNNKLNFNIVNNAYNIHISKDSTVVILKIYDKYGESNNLYLLKNKRTFKTTFDVDPIPVIDTIINQRIYLKYYSFAGYSHKNRIYQDSSYVNERQSISDFKINHIHYDILYSSGLGQSFYFDSLHFDESSLSVSFHLRGNYVHTYYLSDLSYYNNSFRISEIDTTENMYREFTLQYLPNEQADVRKFYSEVFNFIKKISQ